MGTVADVFIIESLKFANERKRQYEGDILQNILNFAGKQPEYVYLRTKRELRVVLKRFAMSDKKYLHLSCHGNEQLLGLTLDNIPFDEFASIAPNLKDRRVFVSACQAANEQLAQEIMPKTGCLSLIGPVDKICMGDAALAWAIFYHLMFRGDTDGMKGAEIRKTLQLVANVCNSPMNYFYRTSKKPGYKKTCFYPNIQDGASSIPLALKKAKVQS